MRKPFFYSLDGFVRDTSEPLKDIFSFEPNIENVITEQEINYCRLFQQAGQSLAELPLVNFFKATRIEIADHIPLRDCHNFAREMLHVYHTNHPDAEAKLYYGYTDAYEKKYYKGMFCHSFLTINIGGVRTLFDPLLIKCIDDEQETLLTSHFGIELPYDFVMDIHPINYSHHIRTNICLSRKQTDELIKKIAPQISTLAP